MVFLIHKDICSHGQQIGKIMSKTVRLNCDKTEQIGCQITRMERMYLSNTILFGGRCIYSIYYVRYNYMFRRLTMAIFRLYMNYLVSSYTVLLWVVYSGEVGGEVGTRSRMCHGGWKVWVQGGLCYYILCLS